MVSVFALCNSGQFDTRDTAIVLGLKAASLIVLARSEAPCSLHAGRAAACC